jgi:hypothetical protein
MPFVTLAATPHELVPNFAKAITTSRPVTPDMADSYTVSS